MKLAKEGIETSSFDNENARCFATGIQTDRNICATCEYKYDCSGSPHDRDECEDEDSV